MEQREAQNLPQLPPNVFIQYSAPQNNGDKNYYKLENIPFQHNINMNQGISLMNQPCVITPSSSFISNQCVNTGGRYVSWNHIQQVKSDDQMIYQIMYPIIDNSGGTLDAQTLAKSTTVDANVLASGACAVLAPAKIDGKHLVNSYVIEKPDRIQDGGVSIAVIKEDVGNHLGVLVDEGSGLTPLQPPMDKKRRRKERGEEGEGGADCQVCGESFKTKGSLRFHMYHHNPKSRNKFTCIGCNEGFEKEKQKQEHELECERNYKMTQFECCFCDQPWDTPKALRRHENKHRPMRKTKRYRNTCVCVECNKAFDAIYSLKVHIQKHHKKIHVKPLEDKPFACSVCGLGFKYERSKLKHEYKTHEMEADSSSL